MNEYFKFNAIDFDAKLVYCAYTKYSDEERQPLIEEIFSYEKMVEHEPRLAEILKGPVCSIYIEGVGNNLYTELKYVDNRHTPMNDDDVRYCIDLVKEVCINKKYEELNKPPSIDKQLEDFIENFFDEEEEKAPLEQKDFLEDFFAEVEDMAGKSD